MSYNMAGQIIRRSLLYVPGSSRKFLAKSASLNVDCVAYDLEDSVIPSAKKDARKHIVSHLKDQGKSAGIREVAVRINSVDSGFALDDLNEVLEAPHLDTIVIPKVNSAADLRFVSDVLRHRLPNRHGATPNSSSPQLSVDDADKPPINLIALVESAQSVMDLSSICKASPYLTGLIFAAEDFALDLSITRTPSLSEFLFARSAVVTAARAFGLPSAIDLVCTNYKSENWQQTLRDECLNGKNMGFNGKQLIHPTQIPICEEVFSPSEEELEWAVRIDIANEKAIEQGRGAWSMDSKMIDAPVIGKAKVILGKGRLCGMNVEEYMKKWADQEPQ